MAAVSNFIWHRPRPTLVLPRRHFENMVTTLPKSAETLQAVLAPTSALDAAAHTTLYSKNVDGKFIVVCPNANNPGVRDKAALEIQKFTQRRRRNLRNNKKRKNLNTVNWADIPEQRKAILLDQQRNHYIGRE
jgi:hypothetical protein